MKIDNRPQHIDYGYNGGAEKTDAGVRAAYSLKDRGASRILHERVYSPLSRLPRESTVLNLGSGDGNFEFNAPPNRGYSFVSVDQDPTAIRSVQEIFTDRRNGHKDVAVAGNITRLDQVVELPPGSADAAVAWRVVHALPPDLHGNLFNQVRDVLRPGGSFFVSVLSDEDWKRHELEKDGLYRPGEVNDCLKVMRFQEAGISKGSWPLYFFSEEGLRELGANSDLTLVGETDSFREVSGFEHLASDPDRSHVTYRFAEFRRPELPFPVVEFAANGHGQKH